MIIIVFRPADTYSLLQHLPPPKKNNPKKDPLVFRTITTTLFLSNSTDNSKKTSDLITHIQREINSSSSIYIHHVMGR